MANFGDGRYELGGLIAQSARSSVFRARDLQRDETVALKILHGFFPGDGDELLRRCRRSTILAGIRHPGIARHIAFDRWNDTYYFVEEFCPGYSLPQAFKATVFTPQMVLETALQAAEAVEYCHDLGLLHLGIKPGNIMLAAAPAGRPPQNAAEISVRILGLGQSLILGSIRDGKEPAESLPFLSPEQAGLTGKQPDPRSDVYSLGATLYWLLTGRPPFQGEDTIAIAHQMVARVPELPREINPGISGELEAVVMKALAKNRSDRFDSMGAFRKELIAARSSLSQTTRNLIPENLDLVARAEGRIPLTGREMELKRLCGHYDQATLGRGGYVLITGEAGAGKTRLVEELREYVLSTNGIFLWCQATEFESNQPYSPLRDAIRQFVQRSQEIPKSLRERMKQRIEEAVGNFGREVLKSLPEIEKLLPPSPELVSLEPEREHQRSTRAILNLLNALSGSGQPVVLFIDDSQWIDRGTRDLIEKLLAGIGSTHMLLVCTEERKESPSENEDIFSSSGKVKPEDILRLHLSPITLANCRRLFEEGLEQSGPLVNDLATVAYERCGGNPRLLVEIIKTLLQEGHEFKRGEPAELGLLRLQALIPEADVGGFVRRRLEKLSPCGQKVIAAASVIGRKFTPVLLEKLVDLPPGEALRCLNEGIQQHIVLSWTALGDGWHCFSHERVHEEVYRSVPPEEKLALHRRIADILALGSDSGEKDVYEIALHYLRGDDPLKGQQFALRAARAAKKAYANREAIFFFNETLRHLPALASGLKLEILEDLGDAHALDGEYDKAESSYQTVLEAVKDPIHKARLEGKIGDMHFRRGLNESAIEHLTRGLCWLGLRSPKGTLGTFLSIAWNTFRQVLHTALPHWILTIRNRRVQDIGREAVKILHSLAYAYYFLDLPRTLEVHLRQLNLSERLGESRELAHSYSSHGIVCSLIPLHQRALRYQIKGLEMRKRLCDRWGIGQSYAFLGVTCYYRSEISKAIDYLQRSARILESMGDQWEIEASYSHLGFCHLFLGDLDSADKINRSLLDLSQEIHDLKFIAVSQISLAESELIRGNLDRALTIIENALEARADNFTCAMAMRVKGQILFRMGKLEEALEILGDSLQLIRKHRLRNEYLVPNYIAHAHAQLGDVVRILAMGRISRRRYLAGVKQQIDKGLRLARQFRNHLGYAFRVRAIYYRLMGISSRAEKDFERSRKILIQQGRMYELGLTLLETARWKSREGKLREMDEIERAIEIFRKVGARLDVEAARDLLDLQDVAEKRDRLPRNEQRQLSSLFKMGRAISSILDLDRLVVQVTDLAIETAGGERGYLFLRGKEDAPVIRCARGMDRNDIPGDLPPDSREVIQRVWHSGVAEVASLKGIASGEEKPGRGRSAIGVPLRIGEEAFGLLYIENGLTRDLYSEYDLEFITVFAAQAAISLQNAFSYQKVEELNLSLEQKVRARTSELLESKQELENANRLKSEFLANMSHELRTPLNAIIAMSEILAEGAFGKLNEKQETYIRQILDSGVHLLSLINDVLDLSKVEAGQLELDIVPFSMNDLLRNSLVVVKERAAKHGIRLGFEPSSAADVVHGDCRRIKQVAFNLLTNAVKFTPDGGQVTLRILTEPENIIVCVEDTGIGIAPEDQQIIFDEFRQVDSSYSRRYEGTGLGLSLCRKFVELHGGRIWVESEVGKGSRFYFSLPLKLSEPIPETAAAGSQSEVIKAKAIP